MVSGEQNLAMISTWLSVSSPTIAPCSSQMIRFSPKALLSSASISSRPRYSLRLTEQRHSAVVSNVPWPSESMLPPSRTYGLLSTYFTSSLKTLSKKILRVMRLSLSEANFRPQPLKTKSYRYFSPLSPQTEIPPWSRAQVSLIPHSQKMILSMSISSPSPAASSSSLLAVASGDVVTIIRFSCSRTASAILA